MNYEQLTNLFNALNATMEEARSKMSSLAKPLVEGAAINLFEVCPEIESVYWAQYTPYFNDGDSCVFSVHEPQYRLAGDEEELNPWEGSYLYTASDLKQAEHSLAQAVLFNHDPVAWRAKQVEEYTARSGRSYPYNTANLRPHLSIEDAQEELAKIKAQLELYSDEARDRIKRSFDIFARDIQSVDEDILRAIYGDHVLVQIDRRGTTVETLDHD